MKRLLIYVAHPYAGNEENKKKVEDFIKPMQKYKGITYISPIHALGWGYEEVSYEKGINDCLSLLRACDILVIPRFSEIETSKGCLIEYGFAKGAEIKIIYWDELQAYLEAYEEEEENEV